MKRCTWMLCIGLSMFAGSAIAADPVLVAKPVPFADDAMIAGKIKKECDIQNQLVDYLAEYAREEQQIEVKFASVLSTDMPGLVLDMQIKDAVSEGNPFIGHRKSTLVAGKLYRDGELVGSFAARRNSMGGAFAGYKGSCSVLGRTVKALGKDIAEWLKSPTMDATLGDLG
ncbi:MAG: hypothetical protein IPP82_02930 [Xanthomonadales bacterium]|nr:hypothetical protein [Xanthomonadales bacterium]